jgi:hypothetical protein
MVTSPVLPEFGHCPSCRAATHWGEVIRSCYARRDYEKNELVKRAKEDAKAAAKLAREEAKAEKKRLAQEDRVKKRRDKQTRRCTDSDVDLEAEASGDYGLLATQRSDASSSLSSGSDQEAPVRKPRKVVGKKAAAGPSLVQEHSGDSSTMPSLQELALNSPAKPRRQATAKAYVEVNSDGEAVQNADPPPKRRRVAKGGGVRRRRKSSARSDDGEESEGTKFEREMMLLSDG